MKLTSFMIHRQNKNTFRRRVEVLLCVTIFYVYCLKNTACYRDNTVIDMVYLWVNGSDPQWRSKQQYYASLESRASEGASGDERFVEHDELRHSLRSVFQYANWVNTIFIVTDNQIPSWLNQSQERIRIIQHSQIMPPDALPTYNSYAIEANIHKIPNLSELFLFSNDDFYFFRKVTRAFFFTANGHPKIRSSNIHFNRNLLRKSQYCRNIHYTSFVFRSYFGTKYDFEPVHSILPYRLADYRDCASIFQPDFNRTTYSRFRGEQNIHRSVVSYYSIHHHTGKYLHYRWWRRGVLYLEIDAPGKMKREIAKRKPIIGCINDSETSTEENRQLLKSFLSTLYSIPAEWELR